MAKMQAHYGLHQEAKRKKNDSYSRAEMQVMVCVLHDVAKSHFS